MKKKDRTKFFWISYSDLMTSLFFVMLVLFAITMVKYVAADPDKLVEENERLRKQVESLTGTNTALKDSLGQAKITLSSSRSILTSFSNSSL